MGTDVTDGTDVRCSDSVPSHSKAPESLQKHTAALQCGEHTSEPRAERCTAISCSGEMGVWNEERTTEGRPLNKLGRNRLQETFNGEPFCREPGGPNGSLNQGATLSGGGGSKNDLNWTPWPPFPSFPRPAVWAQTLDWVRYWLVERLVGAKGGHPGSRGNADAEAISDAYNKEKLFGKQGHPVLQRRTRGQLCCYVGQCSGQSVHNDAQIHRVGVGIALVVVISETAERAC